MNFPVLIIEVPHQRPAEAYKVFDRQDFNRIYGDQVSDWLDRNPDIEEHVEEGQPVPGIECCELNDDLWLQAIGADLNTVITIESAEEARGWMTAPHAIHQAARVFALVNEHAPELWDELAPAEEPDNA